MHHFDQGSGVKVDAVVAFLTGVLLAYLIQVRLGFGGGDIFLTLIVVAAGGLWYHWRRVL